MQALLGKASPVLSAVGLIVGEMIDFCSFLLLWMREREKEKKKGEGDKREREGGTPIRFSPLEEQPTLSTGSRIPCPGRNYCDIIFQGHPEFWPM